MRFTAHVTMVTPISEQKKQNEIAEAKSMLFKELRILTKKSDDNIMQEAEEFLKEEEVTVNENMEKCESK